MKKTAYIRDMTSGSIIRHIITFAIPLLVGNLFQQLYNLVDTMVVGYRLGDQAIAAIGAIVSLYSMIVDFACDLNNGYGIIVTQRFGAGDPDQMRKSVAGMMELNLFAGILLPTLSLVFLKPMLHLMNTPDEIFGQSYAYISIICAGIPVTIGYNMFASILRAVGNSRSPLVFLILSSLLNVALDILFVWVLNMGIGGAALATVLAQLAATLCSGTYVWKHYRQYLPKKEDLRVPGRLLVALVLSGGSLAMMSVVVEFGTVIFQSAANLLGKMYITAHSSARRLLIMMIQPIISLSVANMTFIGQNWGAGNKERIQPAIRLSLLMELLWGAFVVAVFFLFGRQLIHFTTGTTDTDILKNAVLSLRINCVLYPVLGVLFCMRNTMQAMGHKVIPVLSSVIELIMKLIAVALFIPKWGFIGVCITEPVTWLLMTAFLLGCYLFFRKKWFGGKLSENCV
ncbi:MAG: MATE family efflux transporter [Clostridiales bacterium]|nr:MATE family efflux transporter [Clostridiales bacterium]